MTEVFFVKTPTHNLVLNKRIKESGCVVDIHDPVMHDMDEIFGCRNVSAGELKKARYDYRVLAVRHRSLEKAEHDYAV